MNLTEQTKEDYLRDINENLWRVLFTFLAKTVFLIKKKLLQFSARLYVSKVNYSVKNIAKIPCSLSWAESLKEVLNNIINTHFFCSFLNTLNKN